MNPPPVQTDAVDTLKISDEHWLSLVSVMDRASAKIRVLDGTRRAERLPYRNMPQVLLAVAPQGKGAWQRYRVRPRDISATGLGFLHGSYMHTGAACVMVLGRHDHGPVTVKGRLARCAYLKGKLHLVGVEFDEPIELDQYLMYMPESQA